MPSSSRVPDLAFAAIAIAVLTWTFYVLTRPDSVMVSYLTDDAFYYLVPAHSFAHGEGWSLDRLTRTSGFQLLYGYVAAVVSLATGATRAFPMAMTLSCAAALLAGVWLLLRRESRVYGAGIAAAGVAIAIAAPRGFTQITAGLEWGWAVMMTALVVSSLQRPVPSPWAIGVASFLAVLTRVDLSLFVAIFTLAVAWSRWRQRPSSARDCVRLVVAAGAASTIALAVTALNSWAITGLWTPNSVAMKEFWSRTNDFLPAISWRLIVSSTGPGAMLVSLQDAFGLRSMVIMGFFLAGALGVCASERRKGSERYALVVASTLAILAYTVAYARGVNLIADHYSAPIIVPTVLLTCGLLAAAGRSWPLAAGAMAVGVMAVAAGGSWHGNPAHLVIARNAGALFETVPAGARVAAWNAGIASWRTGGRVINLDGLGNASVVEPIRAGRLACYLSDTRVGYLMDFGFMFPGQIDTGFSTDEESRRQLHLERNGYDAAALFRCTSIAAEAQDPAFSASTYRLFAVDEPCLAELCRRER